MLDTQSDRPDHSLIVPIGYLEFQNLQTTKSKFCACPSRKSQEADFQQVPEKSFYLQEYASFGRQKVLMLPVTRLRHVLAGGHHQMLLLAILKSALNSGIAS
ncbi:MAG: hypothetical protein ABJY83_23750 [Roseibium sp.]